MTATVGWIFFVAFWLASILAGIFLLAAIRLAAAVNQARDLLERAAESDSEVVRVLITEYLRKTA
jgi:hypothetical protein